jgi:hypothetical protein
MGATADGGGTSSTAANSTTSASRQQGAAKQATTRREDLAILRTTQQSGQPLGQSMCGEKLETPVGHNRDSNRNALATLNYLEIKQIMDRRSSQQKQGKLTDAEIKGLVKDWHDQRKEGDLNKDVVEREMKTMEAKLERCNVDQLGQIPIEREDGTMRIMVRQMRGYTGKEVREIKMSTMEKLIQKYDINLVACMELNFNWSNVNSSANLASWLHQEERETRSITAHNTYKQDAVSSRHQPGGRGMIC